MLHLLPAASEAPRPAPYAEAVSRLTSVRHALRLVEPYGAGPAPDIDCEDAIAAAWDEAGPARRQLFDRRSAHLVNAASAGFEALLIEQGDGGAPPAEASHALAEEIRRELSEIARIVIG